MEKDLLYPYMVSNLHDIIVSQRDKRAKIEDVYPEEIPYLKEMSLIGVQEYKSKPNKYMRLTETAIEDKINLFITIGANSVSEYIAEVLQWQESYNNNVDWILDAGAQMLSDTNIVVNYYNIPQKVNEYYEELLNIAINGDSSSLTDAFPRYFDKFTDIDYLNTLKNVAVEARELLMLKDKSNDDNSIIMPHEIPDNGTTKSPKVLYEMLKGLKCSHLDPTVTLQEIMSKIYYKKIKYLGLFTSYIQAIDDRIEFLNLFINDSNLFQRKQDELKLYLSPISNRMFLLMKDCGPKYFPSTDTRHFNSINFQLNLNECCKTSAEAERLLEIFDRYELNGSHRALARTVDPTWDDTMQDSNDTLKKFVALYPKLIEYVKDGVSYIDEYIDMLEALKQKAKYVKSHEELDAKDLQMATDNLTEVFNKILTSLASDTYVTEPANTAEELEKQIKDLTLRQKMLRDTVIGCLKANDRYQHLKIYNDVRHQYTLEYNNFANAITTLKIKYKRVMSESEKEKDLVKRLLTMKDLYASVYRQVLDFPTPKYLVPNTIEELQQDIASMQKSLKELSGIMNTLPKDNPFSDSTDSILHSIEKTYMLKYTTIEDQIKLFNQNIITLTREQELKVKQIELDVNRDKIILTELKQQLDAIEMSAKDLVSEEALLFAKKADLEYSKIVLSNYIKQINDVKLPELDYLSPEYHNFSAFQKFNIYKDNVIAEVHGLNKKLDEEINKRVL